MQVFSFDSSCAKAVSWINGASNSPYRCPECNTLHGITGVWSPNDSKPLKLCSYCEPKKSLDKTTSPTQNTRMCKQIRFVTAVALAVSELRKSPFSVFNVTERLRDQVNSGDVAFLDKPTAVFNGATTYAVEHTEVKEVFQELMRAQIIKDLSVRNAGNYLEYSEGQPSSPVATTVQPTTLFPNPAALVAKIFQPAPARSVSTALGNSFDNKVRDYLNNRRGQTVTMKEIQSRFKGVSKTCKEYSDIVANLGFSVDTKGTPSYWTVNV